MPDKFLFADEAGCFTFNKNQNVSRYFILCTVSMEDCSLAADLLDLRRRLAWEGRELGEYFHATTDKQDVRDEVYATILKKPFKVQATIMEKSKAQPHLQASKERFYKTGWYFHFRHGARHQITPLNQALVTTACLGTRKEQAAFAEAVNDVMKQHFKASQWKTDFMPCAADPCLQVADYCAWAIQRKWERNDERSYDLIKDRLTYHYDMWQRGTEHYY
ncbi:DUF3800 domain-containing protein [Sphingobium sp. LSP13-1-1.1]|uniref:DUF3800 domain-containing protein n=1 Tax=Sphingobium sp. LSP13-1-1.1 TaxID=3135234 RepID=UPI00342D31DE